MVNGAGNLPKLKVSISARLIPALLYTIPAIGGALSAIYLMRLMQSLRYAETAGIEFLLRGTMSSTIPVLGSLYLGAVCGIIVIALLIARMLMQTKTAAPPGWFFVLCGMFCLVPALLFMEAQSLIIEIFTLPSSSLGIAAVASNISLFMMLSLVAALIVFILLTVAAVLPLSSRKPVKWSPLIMATVIEILLIAAAVAFQLRYLWLSKNV